MEVEFICRVLSLLDEFAFYQYGDFDECIWWRTDDEYAPITFFVKCNDLFYWACADCEKLTPDNIDRLFIAIADIRKALGFPEKLPKERGSSLSLDSWQSIGHLASILFCARERKMRPQLPYYKSIPEQLHSLFDACGEPRTGHEHCCGE